MKPGAFQCLAYVQRAEALGDPAWATRPLKRELVFPLGEPASNDSRKWRFGAEDLAAVLADSLTWAEQKPVYWAHGKDPVKGGKAAGWIERLELAMDGLYAHIRYTDEALEEIRAGAWGFRSPGFDAVQDDDGAVRPYRLFELSLVNEPAIAGMPAITASAEAPPPPITSPDVAAMKRKEKRMEKLRALLGLADGASEEDFVKAVEALMATPPPAPAPDPGAVAAAVASSVDELVNKRVAAELEKRDRATRIEAAVEGAVKAGKVTVGQRPQALAFAKADLEAFEAFAAAAPVVAPVAPWYRPGGASDSVGKVPISALNSPEMSRQVAERAMRLSAEKSIPYNEALNSLVTA